MGVEGRQLFLGSRDPLPGFAFRGWRGRDNVAPRSEYPEPFIETTTNDERVGPQHARKFAAKLAELGDPYLFYENTEGRHGGGTNVDEYSHTTALEFVYFTRKLM